MDARVRTGRSGFTAVELLIATAVGVVLLLIVGMAFSNATGAVGASSARASVYNKARLVFDMMKRDFDGIYRDRTVGTVAAGGGVPAFDTILLYVRGQHTLPQQQAPTSESFYHMRLRFVTTSAVSAPASGMACMVEYALLEEDTVGGTPGAVSATSDLVRLHLVRTVWSLADVRSQGNAATPMEREILATHVAGFDLLWYDGTSSGNETPAGGWTALPRMLRVRIDMADGQNVVQEYNGGYPMTFVQEFGLNTENVTTVDDGI